MTIDVHSGAYRCCDGINRRSFLRTGALMLGGLSLSGLLRRQAMAAAAGEARKDVSVILFWQGGGPSQLDMWDMKPDAPSEFMSHMSSWLGPPPCQKRMTLTSFRASPAAAAIAWRRSSPLSERPPSISAPVRRKLRRLMPSQQR